MSIEETNKPLLIKGNNHIDKRGKLSFVNNFSMEKIKRFYTIAHPSTEIVRAWQGHKYQSRSFHVISGCFWIACVRIDNWEKPSQQLEVEIYQLKSDEPSVLHIPRGYANGVKAKAKESILISFSDNSYENLQAGDEYRYDSEMWLNWNDLN
ncbi:WxcM-like domain-containing protein [Flagellimonas sp. 389]|uniref:WxcM-like domain-containing protein n=1 Tax=Flagellimonas sp. 389 TaxID=2835862 RepID=UPI001BD491F2|nr:WxcM-like domain-containing protein [Flagellimonas sp. 389]MBS9461263.1 WxcM-like domain-containing protein [Flagellimonas sp. 389]